MSFKALHDALGGFRSWVLVDAPRQGRVLVCVPPKCGWTSFRAAVAPETLRKGRTFTGAMAERGLGMFAPHQATQRDEPAFLAVRDPVERYRSMCRVIAAEPGWARKQLIAEPYRDPDRLIGLIEQAPMGNVHWYPLHGYLIQRVALIRYDRLLRVLGLPERHENRSAGDPDLPVPEDRIRAHYAHDVALWERAQEEDQRWQT